MFRLHPSKKLQQLFEEKPYQGTNPFKASFIFIGLDANYRENIENDSVFDKICEYHQDGVRFWKTYGIHHPFLLKNYSGDGKLYHQSFAKIGFTSNFADKISFVELLDLPTCGRNIITKSDIRKSHIEYINSIISNGTKKNIFISANVLRLMQKFEDLKWIKSSRLKEEGCTLPILYKSNNSTVYLHLHFSNYGKFQNQKVQESTEIAKIAKIELSS